MKNHQSDSDIPHRRILPSWARGVIVAVVVQIVLMGLGFVGQSELTKWSDRCHQRFFDECRSVTSACADVLMFSHCYPDLPKAVFASLLTGPSPLLLLIMSSFPPISRLSTELYELHAGLAMFWLPVIFSFLIYASVGAILYSTLSRKIASVLLFLVFVVSIGIGTVFWLLWLVMI